MVPVKVMRKTERRRDFAINRVSLRLKSAVPVIAIRGPIAESRRPPNVRYAPFKGEKMWARRVVKKH